MISLQYIKGIRLTIKNMKEILFTMFFAIFLTCGISYAEGEVEIQGKGVGINNELNDASLYQTSLKLDLQNTTTISNGSINLTGSNHEVAVQLIPQNWIFSSHPDGSFRGQGQAKTSQDDIYNVQLMGKRMYVTNNGSAWEVKGSLVKGTAQYSLYCIVSGNDLFPYTKSSLVEFLVIPRGITGPTNFTSFIPLHLEIFRGTTVVWINEDDAPHVIQSIDERGKITPFFSSNVLNTNEIFRYTFVNPGIYHYNDPLNPWREGSVIVW